MPEAREPYNGDRSALKYRLSASTGKPESSKGFQPRKPATPTKVLIPQRGQGQTIASTVDRIMNKIKLLLWKFWREERLILLLSVGFAAVAVLGLWRWISLPSPKYFLPLSAADWAAWGTCFGAVGTDRKSVV